MHIFKTVSDIRIAPGGAATLDMLVEGLCSNNRIAIVTDKRSKAQALTYKFSTKSSLTHPIASS